MASEVNLVNFEILSNVSNFQANFSAKKFNENGFSETLGRSPRYPHQKVVPEKIMKRKNDFSSFELSSIYWIQILFAFFFHVRA